MQQFPSSTVFKLILLPKGNITYSHSGPQRLFNYFYWMLQTAEKSEAAVLVNTLGSQYSYLRWYSYILFQNGITAIASILVGQIAAGFVHVFVFASDRSGFLTTLKCRASKITSQTLNGAVPRYPDTFPSGSQNYILRIMFSVQFFLVVLVVACLYQRKNVQKWIVGLLSRTIEVMRYPTL